mgnify:CR=1 FL=1
MPITLDTSLPPSLYPLAWLIGVPWEDAATVGGLIGTNFCGNKAGYLADAFRFFKQRTQLLLKQYRL